MHEDGYLLFLTEEPLQFGPSRFAFAANDSESTADHEENRGNDERDRRRIERIDRDDGIDPLQVRKPRLDATHTPPHVPNHKNVLLLAIPVDLEGKSAGTCPASSSGRP